MRKSEERNEEEEEEQEEEEEEEEVLDTGHIQLFRPLLTQFKDGTKNIKDKI